MNVATVRDSTYFENSPTCDGISFPSQDADIDGAVITVRGRYPIEGFLVNERCKELVYVTEGNGMLLSPTASTSFKKGDVIFVGQYEQFAWEGSFVGFFATTPKFDPKQHREVAL